MKITIPLTPPSLTVTEKQFTHTVIEYAEYMGWLVYHVLDTQHYAKRTSKGFPDLVMVKDGTLVFAELKSEKGRLTEHQKIWGVALEEVAEETYKAFWEHVVYFVWRPSDWDEIEKVLK